MIHNNLLIFITSCFILQIIYLLSLVMFLTFVPLFILFIFPRYCHSFDILYSYSFHFFVPLVQMTDARQPYILHFIIRNRRTALMSNFYPSANRGVVIIMSVIKSNRTKVCLLSE